MYKCIHIAACVVCGLGRALKIESTICILVYVYKHVYKRILIYNEGCGIKNTLY